MSKSDLEREERGTEEPIGDLDVPEHQAEEVTGGKYTLSDVLIGDGPPPAPPPPK